MKDAQTLIDQVRWNCQVASAGQSGLFSLCGTLLRLRQLYKWEHRLLPWQEPDPGEVLAWVESRESDWDALEGQPWRELSWGGLSFDPLAVEAVNQYLIPQDMAYGAGLSLGLAPTCFLGELAEVRHQDNVTVLVLGDELARDLDGTPALCQGNLVYARRETLAYYLWDRLSDPVQQKSPFMEGALSAHRIPFLRFLRRPQDFREPFGAFLAAELEAVIHHELGEALEPSLKDVLPAILELFPQTRVELWARALKDTLADVNEWGRLAYLIARRQLSSLALMLALRPGLYHLLFPELEAAFWEVAQREDWDALEGCRARALERLRQTAADLTEMFATRDSVSRRGLLAEITARFLSPLGL